MNNILHNKAYAFAIRVVKGFQFFCKEKREFVLSKRLLICGTSFGANVAEENEAISNADFSYKISIAYEETLETKHWLSLLRDTNFINSKTFESMFNDIDELAKILYSILKSTRIKNY